VLHAPFDLIATGTAAGGGLLRRVRDLRVFEPRDPNPLELSGLVRILAAAPQLRTFVADHEFRGDSAPWDTAEQAAASGDPAVLALYHRRLRRLDISFASLERGGNSAHLNVGLMWLSRRQFPRLQELIFDGTPYVATDDDTW
jgi:hypothetical protein